MFSEPDVELLQVSVIATTAIASALVVLNLSRRGKLTFRYTAGWLGLFVLATALGVLAPLTKPIADWIGVTPGVVVTMGVALGLLAICVQLSISISGMQEQLRRVAEELAILEQRAKSSKSD